MTLLREIELLLAETGLSPSQFGRKAMGDPRLIADLRRGRELRPCSEERLRLFMARARREAQA